MKGAEREERDGGRKGIIIREGGRQEERVLRRLRRVWRKAGKDIVACRISSLYR